VINTWPWSIATDSAFSTLLSGYSALDSVQAGCARCEENQCDTTVGWGGSPDETGETTLDAMIMDGDTMAVGSVANLRRVKQASAVARAVMNYTQHTLLAGDQATAFALSLGFQEESLTGPVSAKMTKDWIAVNCQPNYRATTGISPDPTQFCGPYTPTAGVNINSNYPFHPQPPPTQEEEEEERIQILSNDLIDDADVAGYDSTTVSTSPSSFSSRVQRPSSRFSRVNHDTIALLAISASGSMAAGTSTNGARFKIPGRVGDSPIAGSGAYVDSDVGACGATGDGDLMMRFLPCYQAVESMRQGMTPQQASVDALRRIEKKYPTFEGAIVVVNHLGEYAAASHGQWNFSYCVRTAQMVQTTIIKVPNLMPDTQENAVGEKH